MMALASKYSKPTADVLRAHAWHPVTSSRPASETVLLPSCGEYVYTNGSQDTGAV